MEGFKRLTMQSPFILHNGPFWGRLEGDKPVMAMQIEEKHLNSLGVVHGGMLLTFADAAMSMEAISAVGGKRRGKTRTMDDITFPKSAREGDWLIARTSHDPATAVQDKRAFVTADVAVVLETVTGERCLTAKAQFVFNSKDEDDFDIRKIFA